MQDMRCCFCRRSKIFSVAIGRHSITCVDSTAQHHVIFFFLRFSLFYHINRIYLELRVYKAFYMGIYVSWYQIGKVLNKCVLLRKHMPATIRFVRKRDGRLENFQPAKIAKAIHKAAEDVKRKDAGRVSQKLGDEVARQLEKDFPNRIPGVEYIQNIVEKVLIKNNLADIAKAYILYRQKHAEQRAIKTFFGVKDDLKLGVNAIQVLKRRYLLKNDKGEVVETPSQLFRRVAKAIAKCDKQYKATDKEVKELEEK